MDQTIELIKGGNAFDDRGSLTFFNDFDFNGIKRFYQVENISKNVIRAFHGHLHERKFVYVVKGCAKVIGVKIGDGKLIGQPFEFVLNSRKPSILRIPKGFANGFKALEEGTTVIFFSTSSLDESKNDDIRFEWNHFGSEIWETKNR
ncbi:MAG: dTDP-4-dehydrorhamnose 3,5-epimerase family protein [Nanoarchaeota archaeon]|nr:dTDP-4-dehydrorhamnose 3,5-epimerase family protein [Nanoarchaeota archaeon]MBU1622173.1 dTDP-4-dehydrorhamnose 3,5-epimerase family protein [Nanoarchaeota archaeon]